MAENLTGAARTRVASFLSDAMAKALDSYHDFADQAPPTTDAKTFAAHHSACKVAIAHIELLIKLARWADLPDPKAEDHHKQIALAAVVKEAEDELSAYKQRKRED